MVFDWFYVTLHFRYDIRDIVSACKNTNKFFDFVRTIQIASGGLPPTHPHPSHQQSHNRYLFRCRSIESWPRGHYRWRWRGMKEMAKRQNKSMS